MLFKLIKFSFVGSSGLIIDFGITYLLKEYAKWDKYMANAIGFTFAVVNNYYFNKIWTFQDTDPVFVQSVPNFQNVPAIFSISTSLLQQGGTVLSGLNKRCNYHCFNINCFNPSKPSVPKLLYRISPFLLITI